MTSADAIALVLAEFERASARHPAFNSPHEGFAVLQEEVDELWTEVKDRNRSLSNSMRSEAVQVGAMALRFLVDCCHPLRGGDLNDE